MCTLSAYNAESPPKNSTNCSHLKYCMTLILMTNFNVSDGLYDDKVLVQSALSAMKSMNIYSDLCWIQNIWKFTQCFMLDIETSLKCLKGWCTVLVIAASNSMTDSNNLLPHPIHLLCLRCTMNWLHLFWMQMIKKQQHFRA